MKGLIIEGVAGTGKSSLLSALRNSSLLKELKPNFEIVDEELTTGEHVSELKDESTTDEERCFRLHGLMPKIEEARSKNQFIILERFHPTYFALMPHWNLIEEFDNKLTQMGFGMVLLDLPNDKLENRSFYRPEMESQNWQEGLTEWYGSKDHAVYAFIKSQENRRTFCQRTKMPVLKINTMEKDWQSYHDQVLKFIKS